MTLHDTLGIGGREEDVKAALYVMKQKDAFKTKYTIKAMGELIFRFRDRQDFEQKKREKETEGHVNFMYYDTNVYSALSNKETLKVEEGNIENLFEDYEHKRLIYSDAHISDFYRGLKPNEHIKGSHVEKHLLCLQEMTHGFCFTEYFGENEICFHLIDVFEHLEEHIENIKQTAGIYDSVQAMFEQVFTGLGEKNIDFPDEIKSQLQNIFNCKIQNVQDLTNAILHSVNDKGFMKRVNSYMPQNNKELPSKDGKNDLSSFRNDLVENIKSLMPISETGNTFINEIIRAYQEEGYLLGHSENELLNLVDDSKHVAYGSFCTYFITTDKRCFQKAKNVYQKLNITTKAILLHH